MAQNTSKVVVGFTQWSIRKTGLLNDKLQMSEAVLFRAVMYCYHLSTIGRVSIQGDEIGETCRTHGTQ
jgi:hypothetical protein